MYKLCHMCVTKWRFLEKHFKPGVSQNTGYFIWLICFDPSNFKVTSCSKAVTRQGNGLLAYDCRQLTLFPRKISFYPKNSKMLLFGARVTEDVGDLYLFSSLALAFCCREITTESLELRIELLLFKKTHCWADFAIIGFGFMARRFVSDGRHSWRLGHVGLLGQWTKKKRAQCELFFMKRYVSLVCNEFVTRDYTVLYLVSKLAQAGAPSNLLKCAPKSSARTSYLTWAMQVLPFVT